MKNENETGIKPLTDELVMDKAYHVNLPHTDDIVSNKGLEVHLRKVNETVNLPSKNELFLDKG